MAYRPGSWPKVGEDLALSHRVASLDEAKAQLKSWDALEGVGEAGRDGVILDNAALAASFRSGLDVRPIGSGSGSRKHPRLGERRKRIRVGNDSWLARL